jgi:hypothetical protein
MDLENIKKKFRNNLVSDYRINYDIKYRMGKELDNGNEDE